METAFRCLYTMSNTFFLRAFRSKYSIFSIPLRVYEEDDFKPSFFAYLDAWRHKLITLIRTEAKDEEEKETLLTQMLMISIANPELRTTLRFSSKHEFWFETPKEDLDKYLAMSIKCNNEEAFYDIIDDAPEETHWKIPCYPRKNQKILEKMLEMGILVPGTDNAFEAFCDYIRRDKVSEKMLRMTMHPDYSKRKDPQGRTPLWLAIENEDFPMELYPMLITDKEDLEIKDEEGRTAIFGTVNTEHPQHGIWMLREMGAKPFAKDVNGDNILHVLARKNPELLKAVAPILPLILLERKNNEGLTPIEVIKQELLNHCRELGEANEGI